MATSHGLGAPIYEFTAQAICKSRESAAKAARPERPTRQRPRSKLSPQTAPATWSTPRSGRTDLGERVPHVLDRGAAQPHWQLGQEALRLISKFRRECGEFTDSIQDLSSCSSLLARVALTTLTMRCGTTGF